MLKKFSIKTTSFVSTLALSSFFIETSFVTPSFAMRPEEKEVKTLSRASTSQEQWIMYKENLGSLPQHRPSEMQFSWVVIMGKLLVDCGDALFSSPEEKAEDTRTMLRWLKKITESTTHGKETLQLYQHDAWLSYVPLTYRQFQDTEKKQNGETKKNANLRRDTVWDTLKGAAETKIKLEYPKAHHPKVFMARMLAEDGYRPKEGIKGKGSRQRITKENAFSEAEKLLQEVGFTDHEEFEEKFPKLIKYRKKLNREELKNIPKEKFKDKLTSNRSTLKVHFTKNKADVISNHEKSVKRTREVINDSEVINNNIFPFESFDENNKPPKKRKTREAKESAENRPVTNESVQPQEVRGEENIQIDSEVFIKKERGDNHLIQNQQILTSSSIEYITIEDDEDETDKKPTFPLSTSIIKPPSSSTVNVSTQISISMTAPTVMQLKKRQILNIDDDSSNVDKKIIQEENTNIPQLILPVVQELGPSSNGVTSAFQAPQVPQSQILQQQVSQENPLTSQTQTSQVPQSQNLQQQVPQQKLQEKPQQNVLTLQAQDLKPVLQPQNPQQQVPQQKLPQQKLQEKPQQNVLTLQTQDLTPVSQSQNPQQQVPQQKLQEKPQQNVLTLQAQNLKPVSQPEVQPNRQNPQLQLPQRQNPLTSQLQNLQEKPQQNVLTLQAQNLKPVSQPEVQPKPQTLPNRQNPQLQLPQRQNPLTSQLQNLQQASQPQLQPKPQILLNRQNQLTSKTPQNLFQNTSMNLPYNPSLSSTSSYIGNPIFGQIPYSAFPSYEFSGSRNSTTHTSMQAIVVQANPEVALMHPKSSIETNSHVINSQHPVPSLLSINNDSTTENTMSTLRALNEKLKTKTKLLRELYLPEGEDFVGKENADNHLLKIRKYCQRLMQFSDQLLSSIWNDSKSTNNNQLLGNVMTLTDQYRVLEAASKSAGDYSQPVWWENQRKVEKNLRNHITTYFTILEKLEKACAALLNRES